METMPRDTHQNPSSIFLGWAELITSLEAGAQYLLALAAFDRVAAAT